MNPNDPRNIVPNSIPPGHATVTSFDFAVRTMVDYDMNFLQDRLRSEIFINGQPAGVYAAMRLDDDLFRFGGGAQEAIARYGPELQRGLVDEFMGLGYRKTVRELEARVNALQAHINRPRWWQFRPVRRRWVAARAAIAARINPEESE